MIDWICSKGWTIDFTNTGRAPEGFIEFRRKGIWFPDPTFWRLTIREAFAYLGGKP